MNRRMRISGALILTASLIGLWSCANDENALRREIADLRAQLVVYQEIDRQVEENLSLMRSADESMRKAPISRVL